LVVAMVNVASDVAVADWLLPLMTQAKWGCGFKWRQQFLCTADYIIWLHHAISEQKQGGNWLLDLSVTFLNIVPCLFFIFYLNSILKLYGASGERRLLCI
jgi:hypothetical protein